MAKTFDLYENDEIAQKGIESPIEIADLDPDTTYNRFSLAYNGKSDKTPISLKTKPQAVTGVSLDKSELSLETGKTATLKATIAPANATNQGVNWASADEKVATVDSKGVVTGVKAGTATIKVGTKDGNKSAEAKVTVTDPVVEMTGFDLDNYDGLTGDTGKTGTVKIINVKPDNVTNEKINAVPDDDSIATVKDNGDTTFTVSYVKAGETNIVFSADTDKNIKHNLAVTVTDPTVAVTGVSMDKNNATSVEVGSDITLKSVIAPDNATNKDITWASSDESVASFTKTGAPEGGKILTGVKAGKATVTVTTKDGNKSATQDVEVTAPAKEPESGENEGE